MLHQLSICFFVVIDVHEECLTWWPLQQVVEVALKVRGKLNSGVIGKFAVEDLYDLCEGICLLEILQCPVLEQPPGEACEAAHDVEDALIPTFGDGHLATIQMYPLPPFLVVARLATENGNIGVPEVKVARCRAASRRAGCLRLWCLLVGHGAKELLRGLLVRWGDVVADEKKPDKDLDRKIELLEPFVT